MNQFVITIAQQKGGAGKTTIAAHLSVVLSDLDYRVAIIDIDPQKSLFRWYSERQKLFGNGNTGIEVSSISGWRVAQEIESLKDNYDIIIIDSPPHVQTEAKAAIRTADLVLIPIQPSPTDLWATKGTIDLCREEKVKFHLVMNRVNTQSTIFKNVKREMGDKASIIGNRVAFASSMMDGRCITEFSPSSIAADEIISLADDVISFLPDNIKPSKSIDIDMKHAAFNA